MEKGWSKSEVSGMSMAVNHPCGPWSHENGKDWLKLWFSNSGPRPAAADSPRTCFPKSLGPTPRPMKSECLGVRTLVITVQPSRGFWCTLQSEKDWFKERVAWAQLQGWGRMRESCSFLRCEQRGRKGSRVGRGECLEKDEELVNVDCYRGWIGRSLGPAHQIWQIIDWWRCGYSSFRAGHLESSFQRIVEGRQCEDVGIRSFHYFCNKLSWEGEKERDGQRPGEF